MATPAKYDKTGEVKQFTLPELTPEQELLFLENKGLAYGFAIKHCNYLIELSNRTLDMEDIQQLMLIQLVKAIAIWDPSKAKLTTIATKYMRNESLSLRSYYLRKRRNAIIISADENYEDGQQINEIPAPDYVDLPKSIENEKRRQKAIEQIQLLPEPYREILTHRIKGLSYKALERKLGISHQMVHKREAKAIKLLRWKCVALAE